MKRILVVDDEKEIRRTIKEVLEGENYTVETTKSTDSAWDKLKEWKTDLLLLDIMLPGDLQQFIKKVDQLEDDVSILYLSVVQESEAARRGLTELSDKIKGYIEKPFSLDTLLSKIKGVLEEKS